MNFKDKAYVTPTPLTAFTNLLNQPGYSTNGEPVRLKDYFMASSYGKFVPQFDVETFDLPSIMSIYGGNDTNGDDKNPAQMIVMLVRLLIQQWILRSMIPITMDLWITYLFIMPGIMKPKVEQPIPSGLTGGAFFSRYYNRYHIWRQKIEDYACTSELQGASGSNMCE